MMRRPVIQVVWAFLAAAYILCDVTGVAAEAVHDGNEDGEDRLAALEQLVSSQAQHQEILRESLRQETYRRLTLETLLLGTADEARLKLQLLESSFKVEQDRVVALEATLQEEIGLREEAQEAGKDILLDLSKKISVMEGDLTVVPLLDSRLRSLEEQRQMHSQEIFSLQQQHHHTQQGVEQVKREARRQRAAQAQADAAAAQATHALTSQLDHLTSWMLALNESAGEQDQQLQDAHDRSLVLNTSLAQVHQLLANLTHALATLQQAKEDSPLVICPLPYRKVGKDCFYLQEARLSWEEAREACVEQGVAVGGMGDLAEPSDISTFRHYVDNLQTDSKYLWVGGQREGGGRGWQWVSGRSLQEAPVPWDLSEPDNAPDQHHLCIHSAATIKFHDCTQRALLSAICQVA